MGSVFLFAIYSQNAFPLFRFRVCLLVSLFICDIFETPGDEQRLHFWRSACRALRAAAYGGGRHGGSPRKRSTVAAHGGSPRRQPTVAAHLTSKELTKMYILPDAAFLWSRSRASGNGIRNGRFSRSTWRRWTRLVLIGLRRRRGVGLF